MQGKIHDNWLSCYRAYNYSVQESDELWKDASELTSWTKVTKKNSFRGIQSRHLGHFGHFVLG